MIEEQAATLLLDGTVLISGEVEVTEFEKGVPGHYARSGEGWEADALIRDDQNLIVYVKDRGLVVVSGCSHSGAVNVVRNAQRLTGEVHVAAFIGGFHVTGKRGRVGPTLLGRPADEHDGVRLDQPLEEEPAGKLDVLSRVRGVGLHEDGLRGNAEGDGLLAVVDGFPSGESPLVWASGQRRSR